MPQYNEQKDTCPKLQAAFQPEYEARTLRQSLPIPVYLVLNDLRQISSKILTIFTNYKDNSETATTNTNKSMRLNPNAINLVDNALSKQQINCISLNI